MSLVAVGATAVVLTRDVQRQILVNGFYGLLLVVLFVVLAALFFLGAVGLIGLPLRRHLRRSRRDRRRRHAAPALVARADPDGRRRCVGGRDRPCRCPRLPRVGP